MVIKLLHIIINIFTACLIGVLFYYVSTRNELILSLISFNPATLM